MELLLRVQRYKGYPFALCLLSKKYCNWDFSHADTLRNMNKFLNIPPEHPGRSKSDTYYLTDELLLRTHTSAHQSEHLRGGPRCSQPPKILRTYANIPKHIPSTHEFTPFHMILWLLLVSDVLFLLVGVGCS